MIQYMPLAAVPTRQRRTLLDTDGHLLSLVLNVVADQLVAHLDATVGHPHSKLDSLGNLVDVILEALEGVQGRALPDDLARPQ